ALAIVLGIQAHRELDIRHHALDLRAAAVDAEELRDRELELAMAGFAATTELVQADQVLHRALAVGRLADDQAAAIILDRRSEDLRGRGRHAVDQHGQRAVPGAAGAAVALDFDATLRTLDLDHRPFVDEQPGEFSRLGQRTPTVVAQIEHDAIDVLMLELVQQVGDVARGAAVIRFTATAALEVLVEGRQLD